MFYINKPTVKFSCTLPAVDKIMPIIPAKDLVHSWKADAAKTYNSIKNESIQSPKTISKCPGISLIQSQGWIVRTWQDVVVETNNNQFDVRWAAPINQEKYNDEKVLDYHDASLLTCFKNWQDGTLKHLLKFNTGWRVEIPKGYTLYQLPVFYSDQNDFTTCAGAYNWKYGVGSINVPVYWHKLNTQTIIPAGTPLTQLILVPEEEYDYEITKPNEELWRITDFLVNRKFTTDYKSIKDFWKNRKNNGN
jgi:hypothetical protein